MVLREPQQRPLIVLALFIDLPSDSRFAPNPSEAGSNKSADVRMGSGVVERRGNALALSHRVRRHVEIEGIAVTR